MHPCESFLLYSHFGLAFHEYRCLFLARFIVLASSHKPLYPSIFGLPSALEFQNVNWFPRFKMHQKKIEHLSTVEIMFQHHMCPMISVSVIRATVLAGYFQKHFFRCGMRNRIYSCIRSLSSVYCLLLYYFMFLTVPWLSETIHAIHLSNLHKQQCLHLFLINAFIKASAGQLESITGKCVINKESSFVYA